MRSERLEYEIKVSQKACKGPFFMDGWHDSYHQPREDKYKNRRNRKARAMKYEQQG